MNRTILISLLIVGLLLVSGVNGCVEQQPEEKAEQLADETAEGGVVTALAQSLTKIDDCTMNELISNIKEIYASQGMGEFEPSEEERATTEAFLESAKKCAQRIEKSVSKISESEYLVSYSFISSPDCQQSMLSPDTENFLQIQANIATGTTDVVKGAFDENKRKNIQAMIQQLEDMGNCGALMMMGTVSASTAPEMS